MDYEQKYKEILEWARKNKARLNGVSIEDVLPELKESEDERIRKFLIDILSHGTWRKEWPFGPNEVVAYLEKRKENPKTADSIPSNCVSDAKCEDRWQKVQDSLPDNGRLVLANDCLGNTLLARYDGEGNWEVSVYDNEDYYCRNTITKWCEIPSEKQKESLHISETCKENANSFTDSVIEVRSFQRGLEEGRRQEQEKQKEQFKEEKVPEQCLKCNEYEIGYKAGYTHGCTAGYNKAMKEVEQKEQKPYEPKNWPADKDNLTQEQKPVEKQDYSGLNDLERAILRGFLADGIENVPVGIIRDTASECVGFLALINPEPAEWSEEDEDMRNLIIETLDDNSHYFPFKETKKKMMDWLKSLRPSWKPNEKEEKE